MQTRFSTRDRQRVAYDVVGPEGGPVVVLLHDLLGQRQMMAPLRDRLAGFARCVSIDLRGHGASATISGASIDLRELALDVAAVLALEGAPSVVLVGHGLGGAVARRLAAEPSAVVRATIVVAPPIHGLQGVSLLDTDRRAADLAYKGVTDAALDAYLAPRLGPSWRDDLPRPTVAALRRHVPALATLVAAQADGPAVPGGVVVRDIPIVVIERATYRVDLDEADVDAVSAAGEQLLR